MGKKFTDFVKIKKTEKKVPLYKAFPFIKEDEEMKINENIDLLALSPEAAIANYFQTIDINEVCRFLFNMEEQDQEWLDEWIDRSKTKGVLKAKKDPKDKGKEKKWKYFNAKRLQIPIAVVYVDSDDLCNQDLIDEGEPLFSNDVISITLKGKRIEIDLQEKYLVSFEVKIDQNGQTRRIKNIVVEDA